MPTSEIPPPRVGDRYADKMFRSEVEITAVTDDCVVIRDTACDPDAADGSPYPRRSWRNNVLVGRFVHAEPFLSARAGSSATDATDSDDDSGAAERDTIQSALEW